MSEKEDLLRNSSNFYGDDVMVVERLQRRHEAVERDLNALHNKVCYCFLRTYLIIIFDFKCCMCFEIKVIH